MAAAWHPLSQCKVTAQTDELFLTPDSRRVKAIGLPCSSEREGGTKIGVTFANERQRPVARGGRQPPITRAPAPPRRHAGRPGARERAVGGRIWRSLSPSNAAARCRVSRRSA